MRAYVFRFAPTIRHYGMQSALRICANCENRVYLRLDLDEKSGILDSTFKTSFCALENAMKRLIFAATVAVIGLSYTTSLQAQTSTQTTKSATKNKTAKNGATQQPVKKPPCDQTSGANHNTPCY